MSKSVVTPLQNMPAATGIKAPSLLALAISSALFSHAGLAADDSAIAADRSVERIEVTGSRTQGYLVNQNSSATKLDLSLKDTPQAISILSAEQLQDFGLTNINLALDQATGVNVERIETDRTYYNARGFDITNFQVDGLGLPFTGGGIEGDLDTALFERIEVIRGANGLMSGTGNPSATVNFVRKRPTAVPQARIDLTAGSWDKRRIDTDVSGALNDAGTVRGRVVYANENKNSYLDRYSREKNMFHGVVEFDLDDRTVFTLGHTLQTSDANSPMWGALPLVYQDGGKTHYSRSTSTSTDWAYWDNQENRTFAELAHTFDNGWQAKTVVTHVEKKSDGSMFYVYGTPNRTTGAGLYSYPSEYSEKNKQLIVDVQASGPFTLVGRQHEAALGGSWSRSELEDLSWYDLSTGTMLPPRTERFEGVVRKITKKKGVDVVFEHVGKDTFAASMFCLKRGGRLVTCGSTSGVSTEVNLMMLFQQQLKLFGSFGCRMENMADAMQKMARGLVHPVIDTQVSFDDIDKALARMEGRQVFGKIILKMD